MGWGATRSCSRSRRRSERVSQTAGSAQRCRQGRSTAEQILGCLSGLRHRKCSLNKDYRWQKTLRNATCRIRTTIQMTMVPFKPTKPLKTLKKCTRYGMKSAETSIITSIRISMMIATSVISSGSARQESRSTLTLSRQ